MKSSTFYDDSYDRMGVAKSADVSVNQRLQTVLKLAKKHIRHCGRVLDIGCGGGNFSIDLKNALEAKEVFGVDISRKACEISLQKGVSAVCLDISSESLPFENDSIDFAFCGELIEHTFDTDHLLEEVYRVLAPAGVFIIDAPNLASWYNRIGILLGFQPYMVDVSAKYSGIGTPIRFRQGSAYGHIHAFTRRSLAELLRLHAYSILEVSGAPFSLELPYIFRQMDKFFNMFSSLATYIIFVARKV